uniref:Uncharacterized protein n=1 Tax=Setaria italica TaxID=4555 RepID=K3ZPG0_SETIT
MTEAKLRWKIEKEGANIVGFIGLATQRCTPVSVNHEHWKTVKVKHKDNQTIKSIK